MSFDLNRELKDLQKASKSLQNKLANLQKQKHNMLGDRTKKVELAELETKINSVRSNLGTVGALSYNYEKMKLFVPTSSWVCLDQTWRNYYEDALRY